ncbi:transcriptional activator NhaR [Rhodoferax mekongensis]|jgi:LysR family transcriptional activator of nhaA|uniref:transcriptional activator NhaR n=1 Tax=Rhodoferax mekongensis TaxID=3068341 RepID=UPI0028BD9DE6|nr:transcriptional activator NhaR [Rhodoferax sp. TBRC 17199]MDT7513829.1 transcriptional activator NhaR [Rhodoferax sp. TBRC 17199]
MNFKHLHYFWVTAKAGGIMRAGEQLHTTPQTLSGQIKLLEDWLGRKLFQKSGRNLELTEDGRLALGYADQIFTLGAELENAVRLPRGTNRVLDFKVGVADSVTKSLAYRLLEPALTLDEPVRMICSEGKFPDLLAKLALNQLDLVIADEPMSKRMSVKAFNHELGSTPMSFFCAPALRKTLKGEFPECLNDAPVLIQGAQASVRQQWEGWLSRHQLHPRTIGEFDDGALMTAFGRKGRGVFMAPSVMEADIVEQFGVEVIGRSDELVEEFFAVSVERRITHPCVVAITKTARGQLFS